MDLSNSLFLEATRGYDCLLVEANPHLQIQVLEKKRNCHLLKGGLSITNGVSSFPFRLAGPVGGFTETLSSQHNARIDKEIGAKRKWMKGEQGSGAIVDVKCFPLHTVLK